MRKNQLRDLPKLQKLESHSRSEMGSKNGQRKVK